MNIKQVRLRPEARLELEFAADWYENQVTGLGGEFLQAADQLFESLRDLPLRFPVHRGEIRRAELSRFPRLLHFIHGFHRDPRRHTPFPESFVHSQSLEMNR